MGNVITKPFEVGAPILEEKQKPIEPDEVVTPIPFTSLTDRIYHRLVSLENTVMRMERALVDRVVSDHHALAGLIYKLREDMTKDES